MPANADPRPINATSSRRFFSDAAKIFIGASLALPTGIVTSGILTRFLGANLYGSFSVATSIIVFIELISSQLFTRTTVKFVAEADDWAHVAGVQAWAQLRVSLLITASLFLTAPLFESALNSPDLALYVRLLAFDIPIAALASHQGATLVGRGSAGSRGTVIASRWISRMIFIILFVSVFQWSITGAILAILAASYVEFFVGRRLVRAPLLRFGRSPTNTHGYMLPTLLHTSGIELFRRVDLLVVESNSQSGVDAGFYAAAQNLTFSLVLIQVALAPGLLANLAHLIRAGNREAARSRVALVNRFVLCLIPLAAVIAGCSTVIARLIYGQTFTPAGILLAPLAVGTIGVIMINVQASIFLADSKPHWAFGIGVPLMPIALISWITLVPIGGALIAALIFAALAWVGGIVFMIANLRLWSLPFPSATLIRCLLISIPAYWLTTQLPFEGIFVAVTLTLGMIFISVALLITGEIPLSVLRKIRIQIPL